MYEDNRKKPKKNKKKFNYKTINIKGYEININLKNTFLFISLLETIIFFISILFKVTKIKYIIIFYIGLALLGYFIIDNKKTETSILGIGLTILMFFSFDIINILLSVLLGYESYLFYKETK